MPNQVRPNDQSSTIVDSVLIPHQHASLSNQQFYAKCVRIGSTAKTAVREFLALLPEAEDRKVYLEHGMSNIFEFAAKLGGVSREQVQRVLQLKERYKDIPLMQELLVSGKVSVHKLARVASVVTPQNQDFWASQAQQLSHQALETLIRDTQSQVRASSTSHLTLDSVRMHTSNPNKTAKVGQKQQTVQKVVQSDELQLNPNIRDRLLTLQNKGLDLNQILSELLDQREEQIQQEKQQIARELQEKHQKTGLAPSKQVINGHAVSRYIPVKVKKIIKQEYGNKCAHSNCHNQATNIHHTQRFALNSSHNPLYLAPLCKFHHEIAHSIDVKVIEKRGIVIG